MRPQNLAAHGEPDIADLAAPCSFGFTRHHGFNDGNKRTGWVVVRLFLIDNFYGLRAEPIDAVRTMEALASGSLEEKDLAAWFRSRLQKV